MKMSAVDLLTIEEIHKLHENITPEEKQKLFAQLLNVEERRKEGCILIQAGGIVIGGKAFLITGTGTINILEAIAQYSDIDGIIGNGNALFIGKDFGQIYCTLTEEETFQCYESRETGRRMRYVYSAKLWPVVFLQRAFKDYEEYKRFREGQNNVWLINETEFVKKPVNFRSRYRNRLRDKFAKTCQVVHCCHRPTMQRKEMLYDSSGEISEVVDKFSGKFILGYTFYNIDLEKILGFVNFVKWKNNPSERMAEIIHQLCSYFVTGEDFL